MRTGSRDETPGAGRASRISSSTCCSRGRSATRRSRSPRSSTAWAPRSTPRPARSRRTCTRGSSTRTPSRPSTCSPRCCSRRPTPRSTPSARSCWRRSRCTRTSPPTASTTCSTRRSSASTRSAGACSATAEVISSIPVPDIDAYHQARYTAANIVVAAAGNVDHEAIAELAAQPRRAAHRRSGSGRARAAAPRPRPGSASSSKDTEQYHVCLGGPGHRPRRRSPLRAGDPRHRLRRLDLVAPLPRGPREARPRLRGRLLHPAVRRRRPDRPLRRHPRGQRRGGLRDHRPRARPRSTPRASARTSSRAPRSTSRAAWCSRAESTAARMSRIGKSVLFGTELLTLDEMIARVDAVGLGRRLRAGRRVLRARGALGRRRDRPDEERFRKALAPINESLAAAAFASSARPCSMMTHTVGIVRRRRTRARRPESARRAD